jgi:hypothetical protein
MKSTIWTSIAAFSLADIVGCGGSGDTPAGDSDSSSSQTPNTPGATPGASNGPPKVAKIPPLDAGPEVVVTTFLDSLRGGDDATAEALLTQRARIETEKANLKVEPPGTPMARYQVGAVQYVTENRDGAHVASVWEDTYADGSIEQYNVTWVLRRQEDGWRIVGLATQPQPDALEIFLNFENPQDMMQKVEQANADLDPERTAQNPPDPSTVQR